jgi:hypothetical protein
MATKVKKTNGRHATKAKPARAPKIYSVIAQDWEESERGWGTRPDGFTLHLTAEACKAYVKDYYLKYNNKAVTPDEYTRTCGDPRPIDVNATIYKKLVKHKAKNGLWGNGNHAPAHLIPDKHDVNAPA